MYTFFVPREHAFPIKEDKKFLVVLIYSLVVYFKWPPISGIRNIGLFDLWRSGDNFPKLKEFRKAKLLYCQNEQVTSARAYQNDCPFNNNEPGLIGFLKILFHHNIV